MSVGARLSWRSLFKPTLSSWSCLVDGTNLFRSAAPSVLCTCHNAPIFRWSTVCYCVRRIRIQFDGQWIDRTCSNLIVCHDERVSRIIAYTVAPDEKSAKGHGPRRRWSVTSLAHAKSSLLLLWFMDVLLRCRCMIPTTGHRSRRTRTCARVHIIIFIHILFNIYLFIVSTAVTEQSIVLGVHYADVYVWTILWFRRWRRWERVIL